MLSTTFRCSLWKLSSSLGQKARLSFFKLTRSSNTRPTFLKTKDMAFSGTFSDQEAVAYFFFEVVLVKFFDYFQNAAKSFLQKSDKELPIEKAAAGGQWSQQ